MLMQGFEVQPCTGVHDNGKRTAGSALAPDHSPHGVVDVSAQFQRVVDLHPGILAV